MKELKSRCWVTVMGYLEALDLLITRLTQFSASYLDYSDIENAQLRDYPIHSLSSNPVFSHAVFRMQYFIDCTATTRPNDFFRKQWCNF